MSLHQSKLGQSGTPTVLLTDLLQSSHKERGGVARRRSEYGALSASGSIPKRRKSLWERLAGGLMSSRNQAEELEQSNSGIEESKPTHLGEEVREWLIKCIHTASCGPVKNHTATFPNYPVEVEDSKQDTSGWQPTEILVLKIDSIRIWDWLDLSKIVAPHVALSLSDVDVDYLAIDQSQFSDFELVDPKSDVFEGIIISAERASMNRFGLYGSKSKKTDIDQKSPGQRNDILHINAHGLRCASFEMYRQRFLGGDYLNWRAGVCQQPGLDKKSQEHNLSRYESDFGLCSRGLDLSGSMIGDVIVYRCDFSNLISLRDCQVSNGLKVEACHFVGYPLLARFPPAQAAFPSRRMIAR